MADTVKWDEGDFHNPGEWDAGSFSDAPKEPSFSEKAGMAASAVGDVLSQYGHDITAGVGKAGVALARIPGAIADVGAGVINEQAREEAALTNPRPAPERVTPVTLPTQTDWYQRNVEAPLGKADVALQKFKSPEAQAAEAKAAQAVAETQQRDTGMPWYQRYPDLAFTVAKSEALNPAAIPGQIAEQGAQLAAAGGAGRLAKALAMTKDAEAVGQTAAAMRQAGFGESITKAFIQHSETLAKGRQELAAAGRAGHAATASVFGAGTAASAGETFKHAIMTMPLDQLSASSPRAKALLDQGVPQDTVRKMLIADGLPAVEAISGAVGFAGGYAIPVEGRGLAPALKQVAGVEGAMAAQGAGTQLAQNVGERQVGMSTPLGQNVGEAAVKAGVQALPLAFGAGAMHAPTGKPAEPAAKASTTEASNEPDLEQEEPQTPAAPKGTPYGPTEAEQAYLARLTAQHDAALSKDNKAALATEIKKVQSVIAARHSVGESLGLAKYWREQGNAELADTFEAEAEKLKEKAGLAAPAPVGIEVGEGKLTDVGPAPAAELTPEQKAVKEARAKAPESPPVTVGEDAGEHVTLETTEPSLDDTSGVQVSEEPAESVTLKSLEALPAPGQESHREPIEVTKEGVAFRRSEVPTSDSGVPPGVDTSRSIGLSGGKSKDGSKTYISRKIPQFLDVQNRKGETVTIPVWQEIARHEGGEFPWIEQLGYDTAHDQQGNAATSTFLDKYDVDPRAYQNALRPHIKAAERDAIEHPENVPSDLDHRPYAKPWAIEPVMHLLGEQHPWNKLHAGKKAVAARAKAREAALKEYADADRNTAQQPSEGVSGVSAVHGQEEAPVAGAGEAAQRNPDAEAEVGASHATENRAEQRVGEHEGTGAGAAPREDRGQARGGESAPSGRGDRNEEARNLDAEEVAHANERASGSRGTPDTQAQRAQGTAATSAGGGEKAAGEGGAEKGQADDLSRKPRSYLNGVAKVMGIKDAVKMPREQLEAAIRARQGSTAAHVNEHGDPDKAHSAAIEAAAKSGKVEDLAKHIAEHAPDESHRLIAQKVLNTIQRLKMAGVNFKLSVAHLGDQVPVALTGARGLADHRFGKTGHSMHIWLNGSDVTGKVGTGYETALHELVHGVTMSAIQLGNKKVAAGSKLAAHVDDLFNVASKVVDHFNARVKASQAGGAPLTDFEQRAYNGQHNAFRSLDEIVSWALTNRDMQHYLEGIHYPGKQTLWSRFVSSVRNLIGLPANSDTALSEVLRVSEELMNADTQHMKEIAEASGRALHQTDSTSTYAQQVSRAPAGIAHRVAEERGVEAERGSIDLGTDIEAGRRWIASGGDTESVVNDFNRTGAISRKSVGIARAESERRTVAMNEAFDKHGPDSEQYRKAFDADQQWIAAIKPMQTEWGGIGQLQQGEHDIDVTTYHGMAKALGDVTGKPPTKPQLDEAKTKADDVKAATDTLNKTVDRLKQEAGGGKPGNAELEGFKQEVRDNPGNVGKTAKLIRNRTKAGETPEQAVESAAAAGADPTTIDKAIDRVRERDPGLGLKKPKKSAAEILADAQAKRDAAIKAHAPGADWTPEHAGALWKAAKEKYLDKGITDLGEIADKLAADYGLDVGDVKRGLASNKTMRTITDEMWHAQAERRRVINAAKQWVTDQKYPGWANTIRRLPGTFFNLATFGHGTVGMITHAGNQMFTLDPRQAVDYWRAFGQQFAFVFNLKANHEKAMSQLTRDKNFIMAKRAGLANDPHKFTDDYQNAGAVRLFKRIGLAGNRGFDALKVYRQERFNRQWTALPDDLKTADMAQLIAEQINHATGVVTKPGKYSIANVPGALMFAPKLEASRWAYLIGDPAKAAKTFANWKNETPEARRAATMQLKQKLSMIGAYGAALAINQAFLTGMGSSQKVNYTDPSKPDFMAFKVMGHNVGIVSPMIGALRFVHDLLRYPFMDAKSMHGKAASDEAAERVKKYLRTKLAPLASDVFDMYDSADYQRRPIPTPWGGTRPVPGYLRREGITKPYSYPEYLTEHMLPIPLEEAFTDWWKSQGSNQEDGARFAQAAILGFTTGATGARVSKDTAKAAP